MSRKQSGEDDNGDGDGNQLIELSEQQIGAEGGKMAEFSEQTQTPFHSGSGGSFKGLTKGLKTGHEWNATVHVGAFTALCRRLPPPRHRGASVIGRGTRCSFVRLCRLHRAPLTRPAELLSVHVFGRVLLIRPAAPQSHLEQLFLCFIKISL